MKKVKVRKKIDNLISKIYPLNQDSKKCILLVGDGRSGTTWVKNIINYRGNYDYLGEPFHPKNKTCASWGMFKYIRPDNKDPNLLGKLKEIIIYNDLIRNRTRNTFFKKRKRLIKSIFGHLFLKWIHINFPSIKIILLLRHPCAVANSKQNTKRWGWFENPQDFLKQKDLINDFLSPYIDLIQSTKGYFEKQVLNWCIVNYVPLKQFKKGEIHIAFYENFLNNPNYEIKRLYKFIGEDEKITKNPLSNVKVKKVYKEKTHTIRKDSAIVRGGDLLRQWRNEVTDKQVDNALSILEKFGLNKVYSKEYLPNESEVYKFLDIDKF